MNESILARVPVKSPLAEDEDRDLAERFARGDPQALVDLIERYQPRVAGLAARLLGWTKGADDIAQEVFLAAVRHPRRFRGQSRLWTYLAAITVNCCRTARRRQWLERRVWQAIGLRGKEAAPPCESAERDEVAAAVRTAIDALPLVYREVVVLRYLQELSPAEVADILRLKRNTVEVRLSRARALLSSQLGHLVGD